MIGLNENISTKRNEKRPTKEESPVLLESKKDNTSVRVAAKIHKGVNSALQNINLNYCNAELDYLYIVDWLKENIWSEGVEPFIGDFGECNNIEPNLVRVRNILSDNVIHEFTNTIEEIGSQPPSKTKVEVTLL